VFEITGTVSLGFTVIEVLVAKYTTGTNFIHSFLFFFLLCFFQMC